MEAEESGPMEGELHEAIYFEKIEHHIFKFQKLSQ